MQGDQDIGGKIVVKKKPYKHSLPQPRAKITHEIPLDKVRERAKLKQPVALLVCILFPKLEKLVPTLHMASVYAPLNKLPGAQQIADAHLSRLKVLLLDASKGHYGRDVATGIREVAKSIIASFVGDVDVNVLSAYGQSSGVSIAVPGTIGATAGAQPARPSIS